MISFFGMFFCFQGIVESALEAGDRLGGHGLRKLYFVRRPCGTFTAEQAERKSILVSESDKASWQKRITFPVEMKDGKLQSRGFLVSLYRFDFADGKSLYIDPVYLLPGHRQSWIPSLPTSSADKGILVVLSNDSTVLLNLLSKEEFESRIALKK